MKKILIIGGDKRQLELYYLLNEKNYIADIYGNKEEKINHKNYDIIILPFPAFKNNFINAPFCSKKITFDFVLQYSNENTVIFGGKLPKFVYSNKINNIIDYGEIEELTIKNALLTAEAALSVAIENSENSLFTSNCLVLGYGRIGKILCNYLKSLNSNVTVIARKPESIALAETNGIKSVNYNELVDYIKTAHYIFNTVPAPVLREKELKNVSKSLNTLIIDLASMPGGTDFNYAKTENINVIHALSLPGKYSPKKAAELILKTIEPMF